jgi:4'-phosphopantetheinyl transferase
MPAMVEDAWAPGPLRPLLADGAVHVWRADLAAVPRELEELLCEDERGRAGRIVSPRDGELWSRSRGLLRALVGRYVQREPRSLRFTAGEHGKPALVRDADESPARARSSRSPGPSFNMSHSGQHALYAFSGVGEVGVDVELARRQVDEVAIAARALGAAEARRLQALAPEIRRMEFLRAWTRHEATLKCLGVGIGKAEEEVGERRPWVAQLDVGPYAVAAVASERPARELRRWDWRQ